MTAPTPRQFESMLDEFLSPRGAARYRKILAETYEWTHNAAHDRTVQDQAKIRSTNPSTPTESIAASKAHMRRALENAVRAINHAKGDLEEAARRCAQALETQDPPARPEPLRYARSVTNAELEESHAALHRRQDRDEAIP